MNLRSRTKTYREFNNLHKYITIHGCYLRWSRETYGDVSCVVQTKAYLWSFLCSSVCLDNKNSKKRCGKWVQTHRLSPKSFLVHCGWADSCLMVTRIQQSTHVMLKHLLKYFYKKIPHLLTLIYEISIKYCSKIYAHPHLRNRS